MEIIDQQIYDVRSKVEKNLLRYVVTGERSFENTLALWQKIYQDCAEHNISRVHVTVLLSGLIDRMEIPLLISKLIKLNASKPITCAWVDHNFTSYIDNLFGEKIPRPEMMNIKIFNNDTDAVEWLSQN